jgi:hypothetical protein
MNLQSTKLNLQLADLIRQKHSADHLLISGRSGFWRAIGIGLLGFGIGSALGVSAFTDIHLLPGMLTILSSYPRR